MLSLKKKVSITDSIFIVIEIFTDFHARVWIYLFYSAKRNLQKTLLESLDVS